MKNKQTYRLLSKLKYPAIRQDTFVLILICIQNMIFSNSIQWIYGSFYSVDNKQFSIESS